VPPAGEFPEELCAALLAPIAGERPSGEPLRYEGTYDRIAEARREDDPRLEQGVWQKELKRADWGAVAQICGEALELRSKDLQIAAWLTEAWCKLRGFAGVAAGLRLIGGLCSAYWNDLYPSLEDAEYRAAPFYWIDEKLAIQLKFVPLTEVSELVPVAFSWADWEAAARLEQQRLQAPTSKSADTLTPAHIRTALQRSSPEFVAGMQAHAAAAQAATAELQAVLDAQYHHAGPSLRLFRSTLVDIEQWLKEAPVSALAAAAGASTPAGLASAVAALSAPAPVLAASAALAPGAASDASDSISSMAGPIQTRQEAYRRLAEAAAYLLRTEPHSPTPYLVNRAIRWGQLPLDQLLPELVRNEGALGDLRQLLNLNPE